MNRIGWSLVCCIVRLAAGCPALADDKAVENKLAPLERFLGEWTIQGRWSDGKELQARGVYTWGLGKKFIVAKTFVGTGDKTYQRYEGIMGWHPTKKHLFETSYAFNGGVENIRIDVKDKDTLHLGFAPFSSDEPSEVRQVLKFLDQDSFSWTVELKSDKGWTKIMDGTWKRKQSS